MSEQKMSGLQAQPLTPGQHRIAFKIEAKIGGVVVALINCSEQVDYREIVSMGTHVIQSLRDGSIIGSGETLDGALVSFIANCAPSMVRGAYQGYIPAAHHWTD